MSSGTTAKSFKKDAHEKESSTTTGVNAALRSSTYKSSGTHQSGHASQTNMDSQFFFEDEIFRIDKKGHVKFGLVIETCETYSGDEEDEADEVLSRGEVRVAYYPDGKELVQTENSIGLADRTLMPGDVVRRIVPGNNIQCGYCRDINMRADVKVIGTKYVIKNVAAERLRLIGAWQRDSAVCLDSWVGSTKDCEEKAILKHSSGSRIEISSNDFYSFKEVNNRYQSGMFNPQAFFPGNSIYGRLQSMDNVQLLTPEKPLPVNKKGKPAATKYEIESVTTDSVWVHWQCKALSHEPNAPSSSVIDQPSPCVTGDDLKRMKRLNLFESCMLQINDRNYLKYSKVDNTIKKSKWEKEQALKFKNILSEQQKINKSAATSSSSVNVVYGNTGAPGNTGSIHHSLEKIKKKLLYPEIEKNIKSKKCVVKVEKMSSPAKDKDKTTHNNEQNNVGNNSNSPKQLKNKKNELQDWLSDIESSEDDLSNMHHSDDGNISTGTSISTCSSASPRSSPKYSNRRQLRKRTAAAKSLKSSIVGEFKPREGDELVTEALLVYSTATVVWQDGAIEENIPSTQLYPIQHLDNHEFFPGDFVVSNNDDTDMTYRDYGVIQKVDHMGRIAYVKWYTTYASIDEPKPTFKYENEVSVYDLKDHPDFQYRPGTMVIRVANFIGEDSTCTAGQIVDNYTDGRVKVWWVDGHISLSWPQDIFEVGQQDQGEWGQDSEDSWETESENSELGGGSSPKLSIAESHILSNIERARVAISRLEEIFNINPNLQNPDVMKKLMAVYKGCRYLDRLLNTNFFHEDNFMGLIERVRKTGNTQTLSERAHDRKNRLFAENQSVTASISANNVHSTSKSMQAIIAVNSSQRLPGSIPLNPAPHEYAPRVLFNLSSTPFKSTLIDDSCFGLCGCHNEKCTTHSTEKNKETTKSATNVEHLTESLIKTPIKLTKSLSNTTTAVTNENSKTPKESDLSRDESTPNKLMAEKNALLTSVIQNIEQATEKTSQLNSLPTSTSQDDSGNFSRNEICDSNECLFASPSTNANCSTQTRVSDDIKSSSFSYIEVDGISSEQTCTRLCSLLKTQLIKCIDEIRNNYFKDDETMKFIADIENEIEEDDATETVIEVKDVTTGEILENKEKVLPLKKVEKIETIKTAESDVFISTIEVAGTESFQVLSMAPKNHKFYLSTFQPNKPQQYYKAVHREHLLMKNSLPPGVSVRVFEDRLDLLTIMIGGPEKTPYEDGFFFFDIQLGREYPKSPPLCHYISYCTDRLNPNLYEDGKVCVSLLGTWSGRDTEVWGSNSTLLQVIVSIQGLILVPEPYFNEAGYEKQKGTQQGTENSRMYNEMVILKMVQAVSKLMQNPPEMFKQEVIEHYIKNGMTMHNRIKNWMDYSNLRYNTITTIEQNTINTDKNPTHSVTPVLSAIEVADCITNGLPDFPLVPASRGFCLTLAGLLEHFQKKLLNIIGNATSQTQLPPDIIKTTAIKLESKEG